MKDITRFINEELKPRLYSHIPEIFPELHFTKKGSKYVSNFHADGTEGTGYKEDRSVVTERQPTKVYDNTRQEAKDIITLFMENHHIGEVWEAVNRLCSIVGILPPESTPEGKERYRQQERRRTALEASAERQKAALFAPEGREVLDYLHYRGWTDNEIKEAELGYISTSEANTIQAQRGIGDFYTLSIPLRSGSVLYGFKFRTIRSDSQARDKYTYLFGTEKRNNLFNLTGIQQDNGAMVVVEGELDALHAQVRGIKGIVATGGGKLTDELLETATGRGIKRITLLFDKDERGAKFVRESIDIAHKKGISILVATFPDGEKLKDGRPIHDVDEYLQLHTATDLQSLINNAVSGSIWLLEDIITTFGRDHGEVTQANEIDIRNRVISLANHTPNEVERELVLSYYANSFCIDGKQAFTAEAMQAVADRERATQDAIRRDEETQRGLRKALTLAEKGGTLAALQMAEETIAKAKKIGDREKYGDLLKISTREERTAKFREKPEGLTTSYEFTEGANGEAALPFVIPSGALTIIAAPTSNRKSTFLRNLAIDIAKNYGERSVLFFTFEESEEDVIAQFTNTYVGLQLHAPSQRYNQIDSIIDYYKTGKTDSIADRIKEEFIKREKDFSTNYLDNGRIRIFYRDYDLETLIEALEFAVSNIPTRAIFIDYIQILRSIKFSRQPRTDQLKEICISLKDFSVKHKIPIVLAAQLSRDAKTPLGMNNTQMAESSDIEKAANTIICLWDSKFKLREKPTGKEKDEMDDLAKNKGFVIGKEGALLALVTKMRGSRGVGMYSIFDYKGYSGEITMRPKHGKPKQQKTEQPQLNFEEQDELPAF